MGAVPTPPSNEEIASALAEYAALLELVRSTPLPIADLVRTGRVRELRGVGLERRMRELVETGHIAELDELRQTPESTLVVADGFSCRGQIGQLADREALHVAELVQRALRESGRTGPESAATNGGSHAHAAAAVARVGAATALVALAARHRAH